MGFFTRRLNLATSLRNSTSCRARAGGLVTAVALALPAAAYAGPEEPITPPRSAEALESVDLAQILDWPLSSQMAVITTLFTYGLPSETGHTMWTWHNTGPWLRTIVHRDEVRHDFPVPHYDVIEQEVGYSVPIDKLGELATLSGSLLVDRTKGTLSARCDKEELNFLAINLANDLVNDVQRPEEARSFYAGAASRFAAGEVTDYLRGFVFAPSLTPLPDAGVPFASDAAPAE